MIAPSRFLLPLLLVSLAICISNKVATAAKPAKEILPVGTKVYVSVPDLEDLETKWMATQLGKLAQDPLMADFMRDFVEELDSTNAGINQRLQVSLSELKAVASGEVCFAIVQTEIEPIDFAYVLSIDTTGRSNQSQALLRKINQDLAAKRATSTTKQIKDVPLISYDIPPQNAGDKRRQLHLFARDEQLVFADQQTAAEALLDKLLTGAGDSFAQDPSFVSASKSCTSAGPEEPQLSWYIEPFGFAYAMRHANDGKAPSPDLAKILHAEGFSAIKGIAGQFAFSALEKDLVYRAFVHAPAATDKPEKYVRSARILDFPNSKTLTPPNWVPLNSASCLTFNWKMKESFEYVDTLIDAVAQLDGFFKQFIKDLMINSDGISLDVRNDFIANFGERAVFLSDHLRPLDGDAEQLLFCIEVTNFDAVDKAVDGVLNKDTTATSKKVAGQRYWTIDPNGEIQEDDPNGFFDDFDKTKDKKVKKRKRGLGSCVMVLKTGENTGYLCFGVHEKQLIDVIKQAKSNSILTSQTNYVAVDTTLKQLADKLASFRSFVETSRAYQLNYELFRKDEFETANTVLAKMLIQAFPVDKGRVLANGRKVPPNNPNAKPLFNLKGAKLPPFLDIQKYFKPAGLSVQSKEDGWLLNGVLLP